jgi:hypothetical protein
MPESTNTFSPSPLKTILATALVAACAASQAHAITAITLSFDSTVSASQQQYFVDAANYLNSAITGYDLIYDAVGNPTPHPALSLSVSLPAIDGLSGTLGSAGPNFVAYYDDSPTSPNPSYALYYAVAGQMEFDSADVPSLIASGQFYGVVVHEMLHTLGLGTLWDLNNNVNGTNYPLYTAGSGQYTGPNALANYKIEFNQPIATAVPVELSGGPGTAEGHWNEVDFGAGNTGLVSNLTGLDFSREIFTGWASSTFFMSTVTLGALDDLGYQIDYTKAGLLIQPPIPEPSTAAMLLLGAFAAARRRRRRG